MLCSRCNTENPDDHKFCGKCGAELTTTTDAVAVPGEPGAYYCGRHPKVVTRLRCGRCEIPICPKCMVYTPAGTRCRSCAHNRVSTRPAGVLHETGHFLGNLFYSCGTYRYWYAGAAAFFIISLLSRVFWMFSAPVLPRNYQAITAQANNVTAVYTDGRDIYKSINDYRADTGKYPDSLEQLVPKYISISKLHAATDKDPNPAHISWKYYKPSSTSSPRAPMIETSVDFNYDGNYSTSSITINVDGSSNNGEE